MPVVMDHRSLAMHDATVANDLAAEHVSDALVTEAHTENRHRRREPLQHRVRDARLPRCARPRRNDDAIRLQVADLIRRDLVVAKDADVDVRIDLAETLDEVVSKRVVVIDDQEHNAIVPSLLTLLLGYGLRAVDL